MTISYNQQLQPGGDSSKIGWVTGDNHLAGPLRANDYVRINDVGCGGSPQQQAGGRCPSNDVCRTSFMATGKRAPAPEDLRKTDLDEVAVGHGCPALNTFRSRKRPSRLRGI